MMRNKLNDTECLPLQELDIIVQQFYCELDEGDGKEYEPASLAAIQVAKDTMSIPFLKF